MRARARAPGFPPPVGFARAGRAAGMRRAVRVAQPCRSFLSATRSTLHATVSHRAARGSVCAPDQRAGRCRWRATTLVELEAKSSSSAVRHGATSRDRRAGIRTNPHRPSISEAGQRTGLHFAVMLSPGLLAGPARHMDSSDVNIRTPVRLAARDVSFTSARPCHDDPRDGKKPIAGGAVSGPVALGLAVSLDRSGRRVSRPTTLVGMCQHSASLSTRPSARIEPRRPEPGIDAPTAGGIVWIRHERSAVWTI